MKLNIQGVALVTLIIATIALSWSTNIWLSICWVFFILWVFVGGSADYFEDEEDIADYLDDGDVEIRRVKINDKKAKEFVEWLDEELKREEKAKPKSTKVSKNNIKYKKSNKKGDK